MPFPTPNVSNLLVARAYGVLAAAGAWDAAPVEWSSLYYDRLTLFLEYDAAAGGPAGRVDVQVQYSPYAVDAQVPAGQSEWFDMSAYAVGAVAGGADTTSLLQANYFQFDPVGANLEAVTLGLDILAGTVRFRVRARESGAVGAPGSCGVTVVLSRTGGMRYD